VDREVEGDSELDQGSEGSSECVADLDGDGGQIEGVVGDESSGDLGGGSEGEDGDGEGSGASSFDSRDYDMPAGGAVLGRQGGGDGAESSGLGGRGSGSKAGGGKGGGGSKGKKDGSVGVGVGDGRDGVEKGKAAGGAKSMGGTGAVGGGGAKGSAAGAAAAVGPKKRGRDLSVLLKGNAKGKRLGQRARRALLEKMYGQNARHVREGLVSFWGTCEVVLSVLGSSDR
jgi:hypothetical protein